MAPAPSARIALRVPRPRTPALRSAAQQGQRKRPVGPLDRKTGVDSQGLFIPSGLMSVPPAGAKPTRPGPRDGRRGSRLRNRHGFAARRPETVLRAGFAGPGASPAKTGPAASVQVGHGSWHAAPFGREVLHQRSGPGATGIREPAPTDALSSALCTAPCRTLCTSWCANALIRPSEAARNRRDFRMLAWEFGSGGRDRRIPASHSNNSDIPDRLHRDSRL